MHQWKIMQIWVREENIVVAWIHTQSMKVLEALYFLTPKNYRYFIRPHFFFSYGLNSWKPKFKSDRHISSHDWEWHVAISSRGDPFRINWSLERGWIDNQNWEGWSILILADFKLSYWLSTTSYTCKSINIMTRT